MGYNSALRNDLCDVKHIAPNMANCGDNEDIFEHLELSYKPFSIGNHTMNIYNNNNNCSDMNGYQFKDKIN